MKLWKQGLLGAATAIALSVIMLVVLHFSSKLKLDANGHVIQPPPPQYPYVDQIKMTLVLKPDERFVSIQPIGTMGSNYCLLTEVTEPPTPGGKRVFRMYSCQIEGTGAMISQPYHFFTIQEQ